MGSSGIEGFVAETHNWGKAVAFWQELGFHLDFETDHHSGQMSHPGGGPFIFIAERPADHTLQLTPILALDDPAGFTPPHAGTVEQPFKAQHWGVVEMVVRDPDGRTVSIQAPAPELS
jgi:hypothetical protein